MASPTTLDPASIRSGLARLVGDVQLADPDAAARYDNDITGDHHGRSAAVVRPRDVDEVAAILRWCGDAGVRVVPQGGNTGLVAGATPSQDGLEVVLSLERMNAVRSIDLLDGVAVVEAGCVLSRFKADVESAGGFFPLTIGSQGSCQIGGVISTNAGGVNVVRHGMTRALVLGLEAVLPDGRIYRDLRGLHKNNTGYDLRQLFVGAEGTLGVVTAAALRIQPMPTQSETMFLALRSVEEVIRVFGRMRREAGDLISAFELMLRVSVERVCATENGVRNPFADFHPAYALVEMSTAGGPPIRPWIEAYVGGLIEEGVVLDAVLAENVEQAHNIWDLRERIVDSQARLGPYLRSDVSIPISAVPAFIERGMAAVEALAPGAQPHPYGHVGDGNIHFNVMRAADMAPQAFAARMEVIEHALFELVDSFGGSISAEHGIGVVKRAAFASRIDPVQEDLMRRLKQALDPGGLMSPGRILRALHATKPTGE